MSNAAKNAHTQPAHRSGVDRRGAPFDAVSYGREVLSTEGEALRACASTLNPATFSAALELILQCEGRVIVSGMGKAGLIGQKVAATFASNQPVPDLGCQPRPLGRHP